MTLHEYIKQIYEDTTDPLYIIRFIDYIVGTTNRRTLFIVNGYEVIPLITGVLENNKSKERFYSLAQFYNKITNENVKETDINIFRNIYVNNTHSLWRILCNINENTILEFFDQKYRSFLIYRDIKKYIRNIKLTKRNDIITVLWKNEEFTLNYTKIDCPKRHSMIYELLEAYEDKNITDLYFSINNTKYLIS
jgi:hypothetical protein